MCTVRILYTIQCILYKNVSTNSTTKLPFSLKKVQPRVHGLKENNFLLPILGGEALKLMRSDVRSNKVWPYLNKYRILIPSILKHGANYVSGLFLNMTSAMQDEDN